MSGDTTLPKSWTVARVGDICLDLQYGYTASAVAEPCGPRFLRITDIQEGQVSWPSVPYCAIDTDLIRKYSLRAGDIIFARTGGTVGKSYIISAVPETAIFASYLIRLTAHPDINPKYLYCFFQSLSYWEQIGLKKGGLQGNVNATTLSSLELPLCPTNEQNRIVAKVDQLLSELDKGVESLTTAQAQLQLYRAALLNRAVQSHGENATSIKPLSELIGPIQQGWSPKCELNREAAADEWAIIKTTAVQPMKYLAGECKPLPATLKPRPELEIRAGDMLMTRKGPRPRTGVVCLVRKTRQRSMLCDTVYRFRCEKSVVVSEYLEMALNCPTILAEIDRRKSGISDSGISLNHPKIKSIPIPVPSTLPAQIDIVRHVAEKISHVDELDAELSRNIARTDGLRHSILRAAFSAQLVAQDPNDESASVLLERIKAEKEESAKRKKRDNKREAA
jgi:type I restriction enzyme S subunit